MYVARIFFIAIFFSIGNVSITLGSETETEKYESGEIKSESIYNSQNKLIAQKKFKLDGKITYEMKMQDNKKIEYVYMYHPSGELFRKRQLIDGTQEGLEIDFYPSGKKKAQRNYEAGKKNGNAKGYYENGNVQGDWEFKDGIPIAAKIFHMSGDLYLVHEFKNGKIHGKTKEFSSDGSLKAIRHYKNDKMIRRERK